MTLFAKLDELLDWGGVKKEMILLALSGLSLVCSIFHLLPLPFDAAWVSVILCGLPIVLEALIGLCTRWDIKADVLVAIALIASLCIREIFAAGEVAFIMQLGELLEDLTVERAHAGIEKLARLSPTTARVCRGQTEILCSVEEVNVGDVLRVLPGETIPVDGIILQGKTSVNQAVLTGESLPVDKKEGDGVFSGTVNQFGAFTFRAEKVGSDSSVQQMIRLVQSADAGKARIVRLADRWATWIVLMAVLAAILVGLISGEFIRAVTVLVVFCPCSLILATPTAIMAAIGNATKHGFLVREGDALERLASVNCVTWDKTGTLTSGSPSVQEIIPDDSVREQDLILLAAAAEQHSEHPLGKAIYAFGQQQYPHTLPSAEDFSVLPGQGVSCSILGTPVLAGTAELLQSHHIEIPAVFLARASASLEKGCTVVYFAQGNLFLGYLALSDTIRPDAAPMIRSLQKQQVSSVLLTGDNPHAARDIARQAGISTVYAECYPEQKLRIIRDLTAQGTSICMVGDGINDAPALKAADIGIAMGEMGSDIAVDAADIILVKNDIKELPFLFRLSRHMMRIIRFNLSFSMILNFVAIALAAMGILNPVLGALVHNAGSIFVVINSAFLLTWKEHS